MKDESGKINMDYRPSKTNEWHCPKCGVVHSAYFGQCLKCGRQLNPLAEAEKESK